MAQITVFKNGHKGLILNCGVKNDQQYKIKLFRWIYISTTDIFCLDGAYILGQR